MTEMVDMERLARVWRKMEDKRDELKDAWEAADTAIKTQQEVVGVTLLSAMNSLNGTKLATAAGLIEKQTKTRVSGADWQAVYRFVAENDAWEMLHKRISSTFVEKWAEAHKDDEGNGTPPPGVNVFKEYVVVVKKPSAKALPAEE